MAVIATFFWVSGGQLASSRQAFAQTTIPGSVLPISSVATGDLRILLMLKSDVGREESQAISAENLHQLSMAVGVDLTWEGNTRTHGQILRLPLEVSASRARALAEALSLQSGVLWASVRAPEQAGSKLQTQKSLSAPIRRMVVRLKADRLDQDLDPAVLEKLIPAAGMYLSVTGRTAFARILTLSTPVTLDQAVSIQKALEELPEVRYADPDGSIHLESSPEITPNDPLFWRNWHVQGPFFNPDGSVNGYLGSSNVQAAWNLTEGRSSVGVAVLDTGILFGHPDLQKALGRQPQKRGWDMVTDVTRARDGNARDPDAQDEGDWVDQGTVCNEDEGLSASSWHGSHVAGIIAATTNNQVGVAGVNWRSKLVPVRVLAGCPNETMTDLADAILWSSGAKEVPGAKPNKTPVQVMNMSLGMDLPCPSVYQEAIDFALLQGVSIVVSAGNANSASSGAPANCRGVINVAALSPMGDKAYYSNYGSDITVAAPGGQARWPVYNTAGEETSRIVLKEWGIWSTINSSVTTPEQGEMTYAPYQGTSMAAPVVTGIVSLMVSVDRHRKLTPARVIQILKDTTRPFPKSVPVFTALKTNQQTGVVEAFTWKNSQPSSCTTVLQGQCGAGIVDAKAAVEAVLNLQ